MRWDAPPVYAPVMELEGTRAEQMEKYSRLREILGPAAGAGLRRLRRPQL